MGAAGRAARHRLRHAHRLRRPRRAEGPHPGGPGLLPQARHLAVAAAAAVELPAGTELLGFEGEIALVIGSQVRRVARGGGWAAVAAVTAANDFGVYDLRWADKGSNVRSKGGDGFTADRAPAAARRGRVDPAAIAIRIWLNGELVQEDTTADLLFPFAADRQRPVAADHVGAGRRHPHRHPRGRVDVRAGRHRRGRGRRAARPLDRAPGQHGRAGHRAVRRLRRAARRAPARRGVGGRRGPPASRHPSSTTSWSRGSTGSRSPPCRRSCASAA